MELLAIASEEFVDREEERAQDPGGRTSGLYVNKGKNKCIIEEGSYLFDRILLQNG